MSVTFCPNCGAKLRTGHDRCPRCRHKLGAGPAPRRFDLSRVAVGIAAASLVIAIVAVLVVWRQSRPSERAAHVRPPSAQGVPPAPPRTAPPAANQPARLADVPFIEPNRAANAAYGSGDFERALVLYRDAVELNPADAESWSNMGQVLVRLNRMDEAVPMFQRAIDLNGTRWAYHFNLARAHGLSGRWPDAVQKYRDAQRLYPEDYAIAFNLGLALRKSGDEPGAAAQFERAVMLDPAEPVFQMSLAVSYEKLGRKQEAAAAYRRTLELAPESPEAPDIRARMEALLK